VGEPEISMEPNENKRLIRRYIQERWNQRKLWLTDELVAPSFVLHTPDGDIDLATFKEAVGAYLLSFPDSQVILEDVLADGDRVAIRYTFSGTHSADFMNVKATLENLPCL
jgi:predicted ester cyclase